MTRRVVYRALIGGYEQLREEPAVQDADLDFICFTDDPQLTSRTWQIVRVGSGRSFEPTREARRLKIMGHPALADYDETLWVDNTVELLTDPTEILNQWLDGADLAVPLHDFRDSIWAEAEAVIDSGYEEPAAVYEQINHYARRCPDRLEHNPHWTGMLARRQHASVHTAMQDWWEHVLRFSRRDQLSFAVVVPRPGLALTSVPLPNAESSLHRWPRAQGRVREGRGDSLRELLRMPAARIGELQQELDRMSIEFDAAVRARESTVVELERRLSELGAAHEELQRDRADAQTHIRNLEALMLERYRQLPRLVAEATIERERLTKQNRRLKRRIARLRALAAEAAQPPSAGAGPRWRRLRWPR